MVQTLAMPVAPSLSIISNPQFSNRVSFPILNTPKPKVQRLNIVCVRVGGVEIPN
ncbi:30S ribosomal protein S13 chloroplastic-like, partial [Trifolium medium]|nr:30S ribosomal protein S13 chloroplastic-like [Trifolium medium]